MPLIQKIETSNFLNIERGASGNVWRPRWPHQVFDLGGLNSALNIPNGKGKSSMVMAILAMLAGDRKELKGVRDFAFAPQRQSHYTHVRIQVLVSTATSGGTDLLSNADGEPGGDPMVFGVYGNSGENGDLKFYSYQGTFEDCPIAHTNGVTHTLVDNKTFHAQLDGAGKLFPANRQESTDRAWQDHIQTIFDMASLHQQLKYQKLRGAEGGHGYFDVYNPPGSDYSASVFYERLAPELLVEGMGELGEEDEHGIEDTIHTKASQLIVQKHMSEQKEEMLRRSGNTLNELAQLVDTRGELKEAERGYDGHRQTLSVELAALKYVLIDEPIPGVPHIPSEALPLARSMVLQGGQWFLPDRVMAEFSGELTSAVNQRALERNRLTLEKLDRSQIIEFACDLDRQKQKGGHASQLYSRETALALLELTSNFTRDWTKQKGIDALNQAFDWVEAHADTNPGREIRKGLDKALADSNSRRATLSAAHSEHNEQWGKLLQEQSQIGDEQSAHREMASSKLFTDAEMASPEQTGEAVNASYQSASGAADAHKGRVARLQDVHASWLAFQHECPDKSPADLAAQFESTLQSADAAFKAARIARENARKARPDAAKNLQTARDALQKASTRLERFQQTAPDAARFIEVFGDVSPVGLAKQVQAEANQARDRIGTIKAERSKLVASLEALSEFRKLHGGVEPSAWLEALVDEWSARSRAITILQDGLTEAQTRRAGLDTDAVVAGKVAREAAAIAGGNHTPLHAAIDAMQLDQLRRESALTLFSALLHTPVYERADEARDAATRLEEKRIEAPVFLRAELEAFCRSGDISMNAVFAHTWLVGIRTRQVECLLDPSLVEHEKEELDTEIRRLGEKIETAKQERIQYSPDSPDANRARKAAEAVMGGFEAKDSTLATDLAQLENKLPELESRAGMIAVIQAAEKHQANFAGITETALQSELTECQEREMAAATAMEQIEERIKACESDTDAKQEALNNANAAALQIDKLRKLQRYVDSPEDNPGFMASAASTLAQLETAKRDAEARTRFRFALAAAFIKRGSNYAQEIEAQIAHHKQERDDIQDKLLPALGHELAQLNEATIEAGRQEREIDNLVRTLTRRYRSYAELGDTLLPVNKELVLEHPLGAQTIGLRTAQTAGERADFLIQMAEEMDFEEGAGTRQAMNDAKLKYEQLKTRFEGAIELVLKGNDLDMSEHMRAELQRAKLNPNIVDQLHAGQKTNHEKSVAANAIAHDHLEAEWEKIGAWLANFTKRLKKNLTLMKNVFGPKLDEKTKEILNSGFLITGNVADEADIKAVLNGVVEAIEKSEADRAGKSFTSGEEKKQKTDLRLKIRNTFYQSVIKDVRIKVCMPSISAHPLTLERKMVSTGQGIAMALMWIVKMADFTTKRWLNEQASSAAQRKRMRHTQFTIIDGAFSSLSDEGLIKDAMNSIDATKGSFQLIITDHDPDYRNDYTYFPTLIVAKEFGDRFMIAERKTQKAVTAESLGLPAEALGVMSIRAVPRNPGAPAGA